jgi:trehalose 6-phosphate synthase
MGDEALSELLARPTVLVSNRGPVGFRLGDDGELVARRGAGGLVSGLMPIVAEHRIAWIAAAMSDADRVAAAHGLIDADGLTVRLLDIDPVTYDAAYNTVCNASLWFWHHHLFDLTRTPVFDAGWHRAWASFREVNARFADAVAEVAPTDATVLVQDYHLSLVGSMLAERRPDLRSVHFAHTPFVAPELLGVLPDAAVDELLAGLAANHACGFHSQRWADNFERGVATRLGPEAVPHTFVSPLPPDLDGVAATARSPESQTARRHLDELVGDRAFLVRVDRVEPSKNLLRGFQAFAALLDEHPEWHERVVFGAFVYPSRGGVPEYARLWDEVQALVSSINDRFATAGWTPVVLDGTDDFPRSIAALSRADAVMVNPVRDGLNLVAFEAAIVNDVDGVLLLSPEAGGWDQLGPVAVRIHPFDIAQGASALHEALSLDATERARRATAWQAAAAARRPTDWLVDQLNAAS